MSVGCKKWKPRASLPVGFSVKPQNVNKHILVDFKRARILPVGMIVYWVPDPLVDSPPTTFEVVPH